MFRISLVSSCLHGDSERRRCQSRDQLISRRKYSATVEVACVCLQPWDTFWEHRNRSYWQTNFGWRTISSDSNFLTSAEMSWSYLASFACFPSCLMDAALERHTTNHPFSVKDLWRYSMSIKSIVCCVRVELVSFRWQYVRLALECRSCQRRKIPMKSLTGLCTDQDYWFCYWMTSMMQSKWELTEVNRTNKRRRTSGALSPKTKYLSNLCTFGNDWERERLNNSHFLSVE